MLACRLAHLRVVDIVGSSSSLQVQVPFVLRGAPEQIIRNPSRSEPVHKKKVGWRVGVVDVKNVKNKISFISV